MQHKFYATHINTINTILSWSGEMSQDEQDHNNQILMTKLEHYEMKFHVASAIQDPLHSLI